jgi:hypothetical protein
MPGPVILKPRNILNFPDPSVSSPDDSATTSIYKKIMSLIAGGDPETQAASALMPTPLTAVQGAIPSIAQRLKQFVHGAEIPKDPDLPGEIVYKLLEEFSEKPVDGAETAFRQFFRPNRGSYVPPRPRVSLPEGFEHVKAAGERSLQMKRAPGLQNRYEQQAATRAKAKRLAQERETVAIPKAASIEDIMDAARMTPKPPENPIQRSIIGSNRGRTGQLSNAASTRKVPLEVVKDIRAMVSSGFKLDEVAKRFPDIKPGTLRAIYTGDSFNWVKP